MVRPVRNRYLIGFAAAALILAAVGTATVAAARRSANDSAMVSHTYDVIGRIEQVRALLFDGLSAQRNYLLTGDPQYRRQFAAARPQLEHDLAGLATLVRDNPRQAHSVRQLATGVSRRLDAADASLQAYEQQGLVAAQAHIRGNSGLELSKRIQALTQQMEHSERELLAQRSQASIRSGHLLLALGALGIPLSLAILAWVYILLGREVRDRQQAVRESSDANLRLADTVHDLERVGSELRELSRYGSLLQSCRNMPEALDVARRTLSVLLPDAGGTIYLLRESQDHAEAESSWGTHAAPSEGVLQPHDCWGLRRGQAHVVDDLRRGLACSHVHAPMDAAGTRSAAASCACLPLDAQGVALGLLYLSAPPGALLPHVAIATAAAEHLSLALANLRLQQTLRHQSIRDPLTGLYNRRYLEESLRRELARSERRGLPLTLMMLDLDHFKALNDRYGHDGGDAVLSAFGRLLQASCREEDIACRYGGEEFTLILPETDGEAAGRRAEQIRAAIAGLRVRHMQQDIGPITVSIGLAVHPLHAGSPELLKRQADEALYRAKHGGRDRVEIANGA